MQKVGNGGFSCVHKGRSLRITWYYTGLRVAAAKYCAPISIVVTEHDTTNQHWHEQIELLVLLLLDQHTKEYLAEYTLGRTLLATQARACLYSINTLATLPQPLARRLPRHDLLMSSKLRDRTSAP